MEAKPGNIQTINFINLFIFPVIHASTQIVCWQLF
uniref:Uncharacterized protein n=1 Tax=Physcomitrium patens TaxID=3218 RepID=A0A2K1KP77_PHYPA|nr:hypothetical protein PHYPA_006464 [Physcomitrium patens]